MLGQIYIISRMSYDIERREAIKAGERALDSLIEARKYISHAKTWGVWDILSGKGLWSSFFKHSNINKAKDAIYRAKYDLRDFSRELRDIECNLDFDIGTVLTLFDFLDNFFADVLVQHRLSKAGRKLDDAIDEVERIISRI